MAAGQTIELADFAMRDLTYLAKHGAAVRPLLDFIATNPLPSNLPRLYEAVSAATGHPESGVRHIVRSLLNLDRVRTRLRLSSADEVFDAITSSMERSGGQEWEKLRADWSAARAVIVDALTLIADNHPIVLLHKVAELTYAHQNILNESRIITDIRPVFGSDTLSVVRAIITHNLLVEYSDGPGQRRIEFVLDAADLAELKRQCERAEEKAETLKRSLHGIWDVSVPREDQSD